MEPGQSAERRFPEEAGCRYYRLVGTTTEAEVDVTYAEELVLNPITEPELGVNVLEGKPLANKLAEYLAWGSQPGDYIYGWFCCSSEIMPWKDGTAGISAGYGVHAGLGNTRTDYPIYQKTYAHELGHQFGFTQEVGVTIGQVGWNVLDRLKLGYHVEHPVPPATAKWR